jgi:hypothetical protein
LETFVTLPVIDPFCSDCASVVCFDAPVFAADRNDGLAGLDFLVIVCCFFFAMVVKPVELKVIVVVAAT